MPLNDGYGVVIGTLNSFVREDPDAYGNYYHGILKLNTPNGVYTCAIDVDTPDEVIGVEYKVIPLTGSDMLHVTGLSNGFHALESLSNTGALDYTRSTYLIPRLPRHIRRILKYFFMGHFVKLIEYLMLKHGYGWIKGTGDATLNALENILNAGEIIRIYVYGEPFSGGNLGVHNIHQNQGDPSGTSWWYENGIWQDGATIIEKSDGTFTAFINKFTSQSYITNAAGHPI